MTRSRVLTGIISAAFCLAFVSSARADSVNHGEMILLEKLIFAERHLGVVTDDIPTNYLYTGHFENNNGKHLGFSVAAFTKGPQLGVVRPFSSVEALQQTSSASVSQVSAAAVIQNPEPAALVLLGTGLAGVATLARKRSRKRHKN